MTHAPSSAESRTAGWILRSAFSHPIAALAVAFALAAGAGCETDREKIVTPQNGACCSPQGICAVMTSVACTAQGAAYQFRGDVAACLPNPCPAPTGACCRNQGDCTVLTLSACTAQGATFQYRGDATVCSPNPCSAPPPPTGACCSPQGVCTVMTSVACTAQGAAYQFRGDVAVCLPNPCPAPPPPTGACCSPQGVCTVMTSAACTAQGATFQYRGDVTVCSPNPCSAPPPPTGACCGYEGDCTVLSSAACAAQGVTFQYRGDGTVCTPNPCPSPPATDYIATGLVGSFESKEIDTVSGAGLKVPLLAVPKTPVGGEGKMTFSIERDQTITVTPPAGHTKTSDTYRFGPDGFVFERPVTLKIPVRGDTAGKSFVLYRINQTTGKSEPYGGTYDRATKTITVQTYKLSPWFVGGAPQTNTAWGAIEVSNNSLDQWLNLCVEQYDLRYGAPGEADADFHGEASSSWAPVGEIGVTNHGLWFVPQGTYRICAEMRTAGTISAPPGPPRHVMIEDVRVNAAWSHDLPVSTPLALAGLGQDAISGPCPCTPVPTPSVGTGDVQVTLTWHSAQPIDLDLWVTEPNGERCWYGIDSTSTGGRLDIDNKCSDYVDGRPENIFWANAPAGEYKVQVDWYPNCGSEVPSLGYDVRVINAGSGRTFSGTINNDETLEVARFTVTAGRTARFAPGRSAPVTHGPRPPKR